MTCSGDYTNFFGKAPSRAVVGVMAMFRQLSWSFTCSTIEFNALLNFFVLLRRQMHENNLAERLFPVSTESAPADESGKKSFNDVGIEHA
jgi:hypothetical protein